MALPTKRGVVRIAEVSVGLGLSAVVVATLLLVVRFHRAVVDAHEAEDRLGELSFQVESINGLEWQSVALRATDLARQPLEGHRSRARALVAQLPGATWDDVRVQYQRYDDVISREFAALEAGDATTAVAIDEGEVDPAFRLLTATVERCLIDLRRQRESTVATTWALIVVVVAGGLGLAAILLWTLAQLRVRSEALAAHVREMNQLKRAEEELRRRDAILNAVNKVAGLFLRNGDWRQAIDEALETLGRAADVDRVVVFETSPGADGDTLITRSHEWVGPTLSLREGDPTLIKLPLRQSGFARWADEMGRGLAIASLVQNLPVDERGALERHGIKSVAAVPVFVDDDWWGFMSLDACRAERQWGTAELDALFAASRLLGEAIRRERAEAGQASLEAQLLQAQKMEIVGQLAGGIAHDFNNLLTVIIGNLSLLSDSPPASEVSRIVPILTASANRAARLTAQLLAFSRRQVLKRQLLDLNECVEAWVTMVRGVLGDRFEVVAHYAAGLPPILADEGLVGQVFMNLVLNARDAMPDGGPLLIWTERAPADLVPTRQGAAVDAVVLVVKDSGCGMDSLTKAHLFEPFFTTKPPGKGTGLGLSTAYGIVKQHKGWLDVESDVNEGSTFRVYLPAIAATGSELGRPTSSATAAAARLGTVLVVEDEPALRQLVSDLLAERGYRVLEAADGPEAIEQWNQHPGEVDLVVTEVVMPGGMNGRELVEHLRRAHAGLRVIVCSGYGEEPEFNPSGDAWQGRRLQKPYNVSQLLKAVEAELEGVVTREIG